MAHVKGLVEQRFNRLIGQWVLQQRLAAGLSQQELADTAGMSRSTVANVETGRQGTTAIQLARLAQVIGVDINEAMGLLAVASSSEFSGELSDPGESYRLARIAEMHHKAVDAATGMTSGCCTECGLLHPCPTLQWATMKVDAMCSNDLRECAFDEDMPDYLRHNHEQELSDV